MIFTIAIPTYNNAATVANAIESAINQDYEDEYEILIVNNASTDNTADILSKYIDNPKVRIVTNEATVDLFANHNVCFEKAKGDYVLFIHSDDVLLPNALLLLNERLQMRHYPSKYIIWGHSMYKDYQDGLKKANQPLNETFGGELAIRSFLYIGGLTPSGTCYSRRAMLDIGAFPPMKSKLTPHDWFILFWAAFNGFEFEMVDRLLFIRTFSSTAVRGISYDNKMKNNKEMFDMLFEKINESQKRNLLEEGLYYGPYWFVKLYKHLYSFKEVKKAQIRRLLSFINY